MRRAGMEEVGRDETVRIGGGIERTAVAVHLVVHKSPLHVVENVKRFHSKFECLVLGDHKLLEERHVEINAPWITQQVAT